MHAGEMLYMGSPAQPVFKSAGSEKPAGPKQEKAKLMFQTWPLVQPAIAFGISTLSTYITAVTALASVAVYGGALQVRRSAASPFLMCTLSFSLFVEARPPLPNALLCLAAASALHCVPDQAEASDCRAAAPWSSG